MTAIPEYVIIVDEKDREVGSAEKLLAHQQGLLHRAFSIFIFRQNAITQEIELLLQQRAAHKYHSSLLWTNTCCSHPRPGEAIDLAASRRLKQELKIETKLNSLGCFHYRADFSNGLSENEIDYVLIGHIDPLTKIYPNPEEIHQTKWISAPDLQIFIRDYPEQITPWFKQALAMIPKSIYDL